MESDDSGSNTLTVTGGSNQFGVVYKPAGDPAAAPASPASVFGAVGSLNNTNPGFDFHALDNGKVYTVTAGGGDLTIDGGSKQFVVEYLVPAQSSGTESNTVSVDGGSNQFVVADNGATANGGDHVSVGGGNNQFVVAVNNPRAGASSVSVDGGNNSYVVAIGTGSLDNSVSLSGPGISGAGNNAGVTVGTAGDNSINVNGGNNHYAVQYGMPGTEGSPGAVGNLPTGGSVVSGSMSSPGLPGGGDLGDLLRASPFGRILDIPGVSVDTLLAGFASATAGNNAGGGLGGGVGGNPFGNISPGSNPFTNYPGTPSIFNPPAGTTAPTGSPGGVTAYPPNVFPTPVATPTGTDLTALLEASPFGAIFNIPGVDASTVIAGFTSGGGNPFGGNPFEFGSTITSMIPSASDITSTVLSALSQS